VAEQYSNEFGEHYHDLDKGTWLYGTARDEFFKAYDEKTLKLLNENKVPMEIVDFCYQTDCEGKINKSQAKMIYELIKDCDDEIIYGYWGSEDCTKMKHMKQLFKDCYSHSKQIVWG
jgi:hypothetical protein